MAEQIEEFNDFKAAEKTVEVESIVADTIVAKELTEVEQYKDIWKQRMYITPGLTCYWQIAPNRNDISFDYWMKLDMKYLVESSFCVIGRLYS